MLFFPNAKINIGLNIVNKRPDGFHDLETVFYPLELHDILEFVPSNTKTRLTNTGMQINVSEENNLVLKAYNLLKTQFKLPELHIHLHKVIPFGAGLGGGSSDAAHMLKALNDCFELNINENKLEVYAQQLGSDCPFFIKNKPVFAEGTGNIFTPIEIGLSKYSILLVKPNIHIPTKIAFSEVTAKKPKDSLRELIQLPLEKWKEHIHNDFEKPIFKKFPEIEQLKQNMYESGALYAQMTGSGSGVFGIFDFPPKVESKNDSYFVCIQKSYFNS